MRHLTDETIEQLLEAPESADQESRAHLEACAECRAELALARAVDVALAAVPRPEAPPVLLQRVMEAVALTRARRRRLIALSSTVGLAAAAAVLLWLFSGGAASVALEAVQLGQVLAVAARVGGALLNVFTVPLVATCVVLLVASSAALRRVVERASGPKPQAEAS